MESEHKAWALGVFSFCAMVAAIIWAVCWYYIATTRSMMEHGYIEQQKMGQVGTIWVKAPTKAGTAAESAP